jgi:hypothetical protein
VFGNKVLREIHGPKKDDISQEFRILHKEDHRDLYGSPSIVKYSRLRWAQHVARMRQKECIENFLGESFWNSWLKEGFGIALGYGLDDRGTRVRFPAGLWIFLSTTASRTALGPTQPPMQWLSLGVKRLGREADHSPPSSAEVKERVELYFHSPNTPSWSGA